MSNCKHFPLADDHCLVCEEAEDARIEMDSIINEAHVATAHLDIDNDYGTRTSIHSVFDPTLLGIRRKFRELNMGHIPIYSPYDCTGQLCAQWCKFLKIYRTGTGSYVAVVEIARTYDV